MSGDADTQPREDETEVPERAEVERVSREFTKVFHDLRKQTFSTTTWLGVSLVKTPNDILVMQQIINETKPQLIVETGVYLGGSALLFASLMDLLGIDGKVIAVDIDLAAVRDPVREHPKIELIEGSSVDPEIVSRIRAEANECERVMVDLDSDHRAHHVLEELRTYSPLVTPGCYLIVEDSFLGGRPGAPRRGPRPERGARRLVRRGPAVRPRPLARALPADPEPARLPAPRRRGRRRAAPARPSSFVTGSLELSVRQRRRRLPDAEPGAGAREAAPPPPTRPTSRSRSCGARSTTWPAATARPTSRPTSTSAARR